MERQYSRESNEVLKRLLVDMLIKGDYIDGYKQIGAGCSESRAFVANDGTSLADMKFSIKCELDTYHVLSYQDSFKFYDYDNDIAYNYFEAPHSYDLDTTDYNLDGDYDNDDDDDEYDDYHEYHCTQTRLCYYHGSEVYVDVENLEDFIEVNGEYHHHEDCVQCLQCGKWLVREDATYNSDVEDCFCDDKCEKEYIAEHFYYSEYDDDYFHHSDDITKINIWNDEEQCYKVITISKLSLQNLINSSKAYGAKDTWFILADAA